MSRVRNLVDFNFRTSDFDGDTNDDVTFNNLTVNGTFAISNAGNTTFTAGGNLTLDATNRVIVQDTPIKVASMTTTVRDALASPLDGDIIYNSTTNKLNLRENGSWVELTSGASTSILASPTTLQTNHDFVVTQSGSGNSALTLRPVNSPSFAQHDVTLELISYGDGGQASGIPELVFWRNTGDGNSTNGDVTGEIVFQGGDDAGNGFRAQYNRIQSFIDEANLSNDRRGHLEIKHQVTGSGPIVNATYTSAKFYYDKLEAPQNLEVGGKTRVKSIVENCKIDTTTSGTFNFDFVDQSVVYFTNNMAANRTVNFRESSSVTLNSVLAIGESITAALLITQGATPYYLTTYQVDGSAVTPEWQGGTAPSAGNANSIDVYSFTIIKTANATFKCLASQTQYA